jgi:DNA (cytosine-5)-methyltransferase 1
MRSADLFCGCGGMSLGLRIAGMTPVAAYDAWALALKVYRQNVGDHAWRADLARPSWVIRMLDAVQPDLIAGCPPCQDFSSAGKRIEGARAGLMRSFAEIVAAVRPTWFLLENVPEARRSQAYLASRVMLGQCGYGLTELVLDASLCGVPQRRRRLICIGRLYARDDFLRGALLGGLSQTPTAVRDHFGDGLGIEHFYAHARSYERRAIFSINEPAPTIRTTNRPVPPGYERHKSDSADPSAARALTVAELAAVQTFPVYWRWTGSQTQILRMIGNAVPPALAAYLGRAILAYERQAILPIARAGEAHESRAGRSVLPPAA